MKHISKLLIILAIIFVFIAIILSNNKLVGQTSTGFSEYDSEKKYYLSYDYIYEGFIQPNIKEIILLDENYKPIPKDNDDFSYRFYIDENKRTGALVEGDAFTEDIIEGYRDANRYKVRDKKLKVVLEIVFHGKMNTKFEPYIRITYDILGLRRNLKNKKSIISLKQ